VTEALQSLPEPEQGARIRLFCIDNADLRIVTEDGAAVPDVVQTGAWLRLRLEHLGVQIPQPVWTVPRGDDKVWVTGESQAEGEVADVLPLLSTGSSTVVLQASAPGVDGLAHVSFKIEGEPLQVPSLTDTLGAWFVNEDPEGWGWVLEIGVSMVPILGDGRDIVRYLDGKYGAKQKQRTSTEDAMFLLSCVGLAADGTSLASLGVATPASVPTSLGAKVFKAFVKMLKALGHAVGAEVVAARLLHALKSFDSAKLLFEELKPFVDHVWRLTDQLTPAKVRALVDKLGLIVVGANLLELVFTAARDLTAEQFAQLVDWISDMPESLDSLLEPTP
jgi:hypothetical protein